MQWYIDMGTGQCHNNKIAWSEIVNGWYHALSQFGVVMGLGLWERDYGEDKNETVSVIKGDLSITEYKFAYALVVKRMQHGFMDFEKMVVISSLDTPWQMAVTWATFQDYFLL